jgi:hypothetical protein
MIDAETIVAEKIVNTTIAETTFICDHGIDGAGNRR